MTDMNEASPDAGTAITDGHAKHVAQERLQKELQPLNKAALFNALAAAGITHVIVGFNGYGDSGQIENTEVKAGDAIVTMPDGRVEIARARWDQADPERSTVTVADVIEELVYDLLSVTCCGWQDGDGSYGEFIFDIAARTITLDYNERYTESTYSQHIF